MLALGKEGCIWVNFSDSFSLMHMCCFSLLTFSTFSFPITCFPLYFSLYLRPFFLNIPFCTSIFIFIFFLSIWGLICVPFLFFYSPQTTTTLFISTKVVIFQLNIVPQRFILDQTNGIKKRYLSTLSGLEQSNVTRLKGYTRDVLFGSIQRTFKLGYSKTHLNHIPQFTQVIH